MSENIPPTFIWLPIRHRSTQQIPVTPARENSHESSLLSRLDAHFLSPSISPHTPKFAETQNTRARRYRNGYEIKPQTPSYKPYALPCTGCRRKNAFRCENHAAVQPLPPLSTEEWDHLAHQAQILPSVAQLRPFQVECANTVLSRSQDLCVIAATGQGKSLLWLLPLLVQATGCSLVITPYTTLGLEGQDRYVLFSQGFFSLDHVLTIVQELTPQISIHFRAFRTEDITPTRANRTR